MSKPRARQFGIALAALGGGLAIGSLTIYSVMWSLTGSRQTSLLFTAPAVAFVMPLIGVFIAAALRTLRNPLPNDAPEPSPGTKLTAVAYVLCTIPFWFAVVGLAQGRSGPPLALLGIYILSAYLPLRAFYRLRLWANVRAT